MKGLSIHITNESLDLLEKQTAITNKRKSLKSQINSCIEISDQKQSAKILELENFKEILESNELVPLVNGKIQEIIISQAARKKITEQEAIDTRQIQSLKNTSTVLWVLVIIVIIVAYFIFKP